MATQPTNPALTGTSLTLDQLLVIIRQLDDRALARVAQALRDRELDSQLSSLIERIARRMDDSDLTDVDLDREVRADRWSWSAHR